MKLGLVLPMFSDDARRVVDVARQTEDQGWDGAFVFDHMFPPGAPSDRPALEAFTTLAAVAAATERLTIGTLVTRASLRPAGLLAKLVASIDAASEGRLVVGIGTGDPIDRPEHERYGIRMLPKRERREQLQETVAALKALFGGGTFPGGDYVPRLDGPLLPRPAQPGGPPIWLGAQADPVVRMAARIADGWNGWGMDVDTFERKVAVLREEAAGRAVEATWAGIALVGEDEAEAGELLRRRRERGMSDDIWSGSLAQLHDFLDGLGGAGASWAALVVAGPADRREMLAREVVAPRRSALPAD